MRHQPPVETCAKNPAVQQLGIQLNEFKLQLALLFRGGARNYMSFDIIKKALICASLSILCIYTTKTNNKPHKNKTRRTFFIFVFILNI